MKYLNLAGPWTLVREATGDCYEASLPGDIVSTLVDHEVIAHPYDACNEKDMQWVGREQWTYRRKFSLDSVQHEQLFFDIRELDTVSEILVNGVLLAKTDNAFLRYRIPLLDVVREGENDVEIRILSAEAAAVSRAALLPYPVPHTTNPVQSPHRNLVRKVQCHSGWDWGPCIMTGGVYGSVGCVSSDGEIIEYVHTESRRERSTWHLCVSVEFLSACKRDIELQVRVAGVESRSTRALSEGSSTQVVELEIEDPELWYPVGYGPQTRYDLIVESDHDTLKKKIGFRELSLESRDDDDGRSFTFVVNGRPVFCKGANWIPMDALPARMSIERYRDLLRSARDANMNMIRVWGGGQYEKDCFYELCDELGLLVWQDFMFSCSPYPAELWFLSSVEQEVTHQVKRLKDHPSIALWCGNNECLGSLHWFEETKANRDRYVVDFDRLYEGSIGRIVRQIDPSRPWWPSSPSAGKDDYSYDWYDDSKGDMHYWSVWHEGKSFDGYYDVTPRFCSEFGFQSFPSLHSVRDFVPEDQHNVTSPVMEHHQKNDRGNSIIVESLSRYFRFPKDFEQFLYLSQVQQAVAMQTAVEYWRTQRPRCMGTLYWQLNDTWPVASWSSVEYSGRWKPLHYAARRFFAPLHLVCLADADGRCRVFACNDEAEDIDASCELRAMGLDGELYFRREVDVTCRAEAATFLTECASAEVEKDAHHYVLVAALRVAGELQSENVCFLEAFKRYDMRSPTISLEIEERRGEPILRIASDVPAFFVTLDHPSPQLRFSDNCMHVFPGEAKEIVARGLSDRAEIEKNLRVFHLRAAY